MNKVLLTDGYEHYVGLDLSGYFLSKQSPRHRVTAGVKVCAFVPLTLIV